jgi:thiol:disulfide interchange protein DsbC
MNWIKTLAVTGMLTMASMNAVADEELLKKMRETFPNTNIKSAERVEGIPGLVEIVMDWRIIYTNESGTRFLFGHLFDTTRQVDLTQEKLNGMNPYTSLPFEKAIKIVKGNGKREFAVFTDPACPFCHRLEGELKTMNNYTMYVFTTPFKAKGKVLSEQIHCANNPSKAWTDYMQKNIKPKSTSCGKSDQEAIIRLGSSLGVRGTPTLLAPNGKMQPGFMPKAKLEAWLNANTQVKKK